MSASPTFGRLRKIAEFHTNLGSQITKLKPTALRVCTLDSSAWGYPVSVPLLISWGWKPYQPAATEHREPFNGLKTRVLERGWRCRNQVRSQKRLGQTSLERAGRPGEAVHISNPSTWEAAASGSLNSRSVWASETSWNTKIKSMGGDKLLSSAAAPTLGSPSPDRKLLRHPILASQYKEGAILCLVPTPLQFKTHPYIDNSSL